MSLLDTPLRQVDPSVVGDDPFWSTVIEDHPAATYVVLPPPAVPPDDAPLPGAAAEDEVRQVLTATYDAWSLLAPLVAEAGQTDDPAVRWRGPADRRRLVVRIALVGIGREAGVDLLARAGAHLGLTGWLLAPERLADRSVLRAHDPAPMAPSASGGPVVELEAVAGDGATVLTLRGRPLAVTREVADRLLGEVASWR